jgi:ubiquinone/menaquinone biosynthesis C-methylase UbiE
MRFLNFLYRKRGQDSEAEYVGPERRKTERRGGQERRVNPQGEHGGAERRKRKRRSEIDRRSLKTAIINTIGKFWDKRSRRKNLRTRWWNSPTIIRHINKNVCGRDVPGLYQGLIELVKAKYSDRLPLHTAVSVGCGSGEKELHLLKQGIVREFHLYELSQARIKEGVELAKKEGFVDQMSFQHGDAFRLATKAEMYDLVYWNNSLHHMLDANEAVAWSYRVLKKNGLFLMDDFIGPSRFQWTDEMLSMATRVRQALPREYLSHPTNPFKRISRELDKPNIEDMMENDPSEAADSGNIINSVKKYFPDAYLLMTGGVIYHLALNDVLANIDEKDGKDRCILELLLLIDDLCVERGLTHYAVGIGEKK